MPNINDFEEQCDALGLQHIEIVPNGTPGVDDSDIHSWQDVLTREKITASTYELYEEDLKKTDIVFFCQDENLRSVSFIGNAVVFTERGGSDQSWAYKTKSVNIPINGGIRTFSETMKDELIASGILGIVADSYCDVDEHGDFLPNSLYGKIEQKLADLMASEGKNTMSGVKVPWLYNTMVLNDRLEFNDGASDYSYMHDFESRYWMDSDSRIELLGNGAVPANSDSIIFLYVKPETIAANNYRYTFNIAYQDYNRVRTSGQYSSILKTLITDTPKFITTASDDPTLVLQNMHSFESRFDSASTGNHIIGGINASMTGTTKCVGFGGYPTTPHPNYEQLSSINNLASETLLAVYSEQPYLYGAVFCISSIQAGTSAYFLSGDIVFVAINERGKVLRPKVNNVATIFTTHFGTSSNQQFDGNTIDGVNYYRYDDIPLDGLTPQEKAERISTYGIMEIDEGAPLGKLRGTIATRATIRMTPMEANYAKNLNYLIAPQDFIPDDYLDDE